MSSPTKPNSKASALHWPFGFAHRGLHDIGNCVVENSRTAMKAAIDAGFGIELDVQMSCDRVPMVFHDETLSRLTDIEGRLSFMKAEDIAKVPYGVGDDKIMSLTDCLSLIDGAVPLLIEVKSHWTGREEMEGPLAEILRSYEGAHGVMSFDPGVIARLKQKGCDSPLGLVTSRCPPKDWPRISEQQRSLGVIQFERAKELDVEFLAHDISDLQNSHLKATIMDMQILLFSWTVRSMQMLDHARSNKAIPIFETNIEFTSTA